MSDSSPSSYMVAVRMHNQSKQLFRVGGVFDHEQARQAVLQQVVGAKVALSALSRRPAKAMEGKDNQGGDAA